MLLLIRRNLFLWSTGGEIFLDRINGDGRFLLYEGFSQFIVTNQFPGEVCCPVEGLAGDAGLQHLAFRRKHSTEKHMQEHHHNNRFGKPDYGPKEMIKPGSNGQFQDKIEALAAKHHHHIGDKEEKYVAGEKDDLGIAGYVSQKWQNSVMIVACGKKGEVQSKESGYLFEETQPQATPDQKNEEANYHQIIQGRAGNTFHKPPIR